MSWIEGVGDEVTIILCFTLVVGILLIAWLSTGIREIPFISVIVVQLRRRRLIGAQQAQPAGTNATEPVQPISDQATGDTNSQTEQSQPTGDKENEVPTSIAASEEGASVEIAGGEVKEPEANANEISASSGLEESENKQSNSENDNFQSAIEKPASAEELRERRLEFLSGQTQSTQIVNNTGSENTDNTTAPSSSSVSHTKSLSQLASNLLSQQLNGSNDSSSVDQENVETITSSTGSQSVRESSNAGSQAGTESNERVTENPEIAPGEIRVRIKFLNDTQRLVTAPHDETIGSFRRRHFSEELAELKLVRFIFNGRDLRDDSSTLQSNNIGDNCVLHCLVTQQRQNEQQQPVGEEGGIDIGLLMFPLFGLILLIIWYLRFTYRQFFNVTSTLTLAGITFLYLLALGSVLRPVRHHEHID
ncbi:transmembrane and ubiquitin-like domain-containing protein 2 [Mya arenaria]|uniref:transmembrane and ubiquitin-like domain-containing protein 2 n=1 Tax=Mya arenaria TaxID=6604 RepID=UPI0022DED712|nr:transmembrane and ubiquitin-like domain-containing protein 2 [Mya arenaria]